MEKLIGLVKSGDADKTMERIKLLLEEGFKPDEVMTKCLIPAMDEVGELFQQGQCFLPEMMVAAQAMKQGLNMIKPMLIKSDFQSTGKVILGTVKGDLHDIGKNIVSMTLQGAGFEVIDLGIDVAPERFAELVEEHAPVLVGMSALLTTTMYSMKDVIEVLRKSGVRDRVKVMIGGAPITQEFADEIGADFYGPDAISGKEYARQVTSGIVQGFNTPTCK